MQTNLFTKDQVDFESGVGKLVKGSSPQVNKFYFDYPGVAEIFHQVKQLLEANKKITFRTKKLYSENSFDRNNFLNDEINQTQGPFQGLMTSRFGALLTQHIAGQKVLGNYSFAYIEARVNKICHEHFNKMTSSLDHFYCVNGICNLETLAEVIKGYEIKKSDVISIVLPDTSIRAFRNGRFSPWITSKVQYSDNQFNKIYQLNKDQSIKSEIKAHTSHIANLDSPIYKVKVDDKWVLLIPWQTSYQKINETVSVSISKRQIEANCLNQSYEDNDLEEAILECSLGQAVRVIFEFYEGDYDNVPEAILNLEGGSWSSIALESSSSGRHNGVNSMHEVLTNQWHKHVDIAIPWFYLGFDRLDGTNQHLIEDNNIFLLAIDDPYCLGNKILFLEASQAWKKIVSEMINYVTKFVYREYASIASRKFLLSTKEIMETAVKFLANYSLFNGQTSSHEYQEALKQLNIQSNLLPVLECVLYVHKLNCARGDFYSMKTNPNNILRLQYIIKIQNLLEKISPISIQNFKQKIQSLLQKDYRSEFTTLSDLMTSTNSP